MSDTPLISMVMVLIASVIGSMGAVFLKLGSERLKYGLMQIFNFKLAIGVALFLLSSVFFVQGIRKGELSVLYPMVALGYVWTLIWSRLIFREPFTRNKFLGLGLILVGVFFVGLGTR